MPVGMFRAEFSCWILGNVPSLHWSVPGWLQHVQLLEMDMRWTRDGEEMLKWEEEGVGTCRRAPGLV